MSNALTLRSRGFTIVEMMIATVVFSMVLLLCSFAIINLGRTYQKGITTTRTQETARSIMEDITNSIRFGGGGIRWLTHPSASGVQAFCIGTSQFNYETGKQLVEGPPGAQQTNNVIKKRTNCNQINMSMSEGEELMRLRMRLERLEVYEIPGSTSMYSVKVRVVSGEHDLLEDADRDGFRECRSERAGGEYCAMSELSTIIERRI